MIKPFQAVPQSLMRKAKQYTPIDLPESWKKETVYWKVRAVDPTGGRLIKHQAYAYQTVHLRFLNHDYTE